MSRPLLTDVSTEVSKVVLEFEIFELTICVFGSSASSVKCIMLIEVSVVVIVADSDLLELGVMVSVVVVLTSSGQISD